MNRYGISGTLNAFDCNGEIIGLKIHTTVDASSLEAAKYQAMQALNDEADLHLDFYIHHAIKLNSISVTIDSIIDRDHNESHYGQLPRHYCS